MSPASGLKPPFVDAVPPGINHAVLTGRLSSDPQRGRSPVGDPVTFLRVEFPVADPERPRGQSRLATCLVEVPTSCSKRAFEDLRGGVAVLAAGQLSDRWVMEGGHTSRSGVIVASLIKAGLSEGSEGLIG